LTTAYLGFPEGISFSGKEFLSKCLIIHKPRVRRIKPPEAQNIMIISQSNSKKALKMKKFV